MKKHQIFISYRRDGGDALAGRISDRLLSLGYSVFFDINSMRSGTFNTQIIEAIKECDDFIIVLSPGSLDNCNDVEDWVRQELSLAISLDKNVIPVIMRGFKFPKELPDSISAVQYFEGAVQSSEYFDAMIEKIQSLLTGYVRKEFSHSLQTEEYYPIKTPLINKYKSCGDLRKGHIMVSAFTERLYNEKESHFHSDSFENYRVLIYGAKRMAEVDWFEKNTASIEKLHSLALLLKEYENLYFYNNAMEYALGLFYSLPPTTAYTHPSLICETFCYCLDLPSDAFSGFKLIKKDRSVYYSEFCKYIPLAFDYWPSLHGNTRHDSSETKSFDAFGILLFEYMCELAILVLDSINDKAFCKMVSEQIKCYYKWLKKHGIYLPKSIQEKVYRYI
ncbi:MAG: toll/interleukin-1 receptor domain-containing protein [Acutalibacteraceae bacterium]|nr:toll/interleukin-1 receptor domain-containing protein [Acutalibacteraceae bacterium]